MICLYLYSLFPLGQNVAASCRTCCYKVHYIVHWMYLSGWQSARNQQRAKKRLETKQRRQSLLLHRLPWWRAANAITTRTLLLAAVVVQQQPHDSRPKIIQLIPKRTRTRTRGDSSTRSKSADCWLLAQRDATDRPMEKDGWLEFSQCAYFDATDATSPPH